MVLDPEKEAEAEAIFRKWGLDFAVVGETTDDLRFKVWSNGKLVHATWHQGTPDMNYNANKTQPVTFTDEAGNLLRLNTGLTWIHVVGNGQAS